MPPVVTPRTIVTSLVDGHVAIEAVRGRPRAFRPDEAVRPVVAGRGGQLERCAGRPLGRDRDGSRRPSGSPLCASVTVPVMTPNSSGISTVRSTAMGSCCGVRVVGDEHDQRLVVAGREVGATEGHLATWDSPGATRAGSPDPRRSRAASRERLDRAVALVGGPVDRLVEVAQDHGRVDVPVVAADGVERDVEDRAIAHRRVAGTATASNVSTSTMKTTGSGSWIAKQVDEVLHADVLRRQAGEGLGRQAGRRDPGRCRGRRSRPPGRSACRRVKSSAMRRGPGRRSRPGRR